MDLLTSYLAINPDSGLPSEQRLYQLACLVRASLCRYRRLKFGGDPLERDAPILDRAFFGAGEFPP